MPPVLDNSESPGAPLKLMKVLPCDSARGPAGLRGVLMNEHSILLWVDKRSSLLPGTLDIAYNGQRAGC